MSNAKDAIRPVAIDPMTVDPRIGSGYPDPFAVDCADREKRALGNAFGLTHFGVNLVRLTPGTMSSQRHWHTKEDEFVYILEGDLVLITDDGERAMTPGMVAGFPAGAENGHHLVNRSERDALYLEIGDRREGDEVDYPDIDMQVKWIDGGRRYVHKDGTPY